MVADFPHKGATNLTPLFLHGAAPADMTGWSAVLSALLDGLKDGLLAGIVFGLLQLIFDGAFAWGWQSMLLDYLVAFPPLGLAGLFLGK